MPHDHVNLGFPSICDWWCMSITDGDKTIPVVFTKEQALEVARRINDHYKAGSQ